MAALVLWLYNGTVFCFVVVVLFFKRRRKLCLFSLLSYATDNFIAKCPAEFLVLQVTCISVQNSEISAIFGSDFATTAHAYLAHCLELTKFIVVHLNLVLIVLFNGEISIIPSMSSLRL